MAVAKCCQKYRDALPNSVNPDKSRGITWVIVALHVHAGEENRKRQVSQRDQPTKDMYRM